MKTKLLQIKIITYFFLMTYPQKITLNSQKMQKKFQKRERAGFLTNRFFTYLEWFFGGKSFKKISDDFYLQQLCFWPFFHWTNQKMNNYVCSISSPYLLIILFRFCCEGRKSIDQETIRCVKALDSHNRMLTRDFISILGDRILCVYVCMYV